MLLLNRNAQACCFVGEPIQATAHKGVLLYKHNLVHMLLGQSNSNFGKVPMVKKRKYAAATTIEEQAVC
jgi:hypothetical protein